MGQRDMSIVFSSRIDSFKECNSSFDSGILRVCYTGKNRNNSFISKDTFEQCMPSIYNCPIVCRYDRETDTIGSHDVELVSDDDGGMHIVNVTTPVGVVPQGAKYWWEEIEDASGLHEYLCVNVLLWKRQEAYKKIKEDGITYESMEISVKEGEMVNGIYVIKRFEFTAFCLLGTAQPCYESASLEIFSHNNFALNINEMMCDLKESFSMIQSSKEVVINLEILSEGGEKILEQKNELMSEYGLSADMLDFDLDDYTIDELKIKFEEIKNSATIEDKHNKENFVLAEQFREELMDVLNAETIETNLGIMPRYYYVDRDDEAKEVYCYDVEDWKLYGFVYSMNGDHISVDFQCKKRKKFSIVDFDEGEQPSVFAEVFETISNKFTENNSEWHEKYQTATETISNMEHELEDLRQFKNDTLGAIELEKRNSVLAKFGDLDGVSEFDELREQCMDYSIEALEEKCYAIRGRNIATAKFEYKPKTTKLAVEKNMVSHDPYGGIFAKYGFSNNN